MMLYIIVNHVKLQKTNEKIHFLHKNVGLLRNFSYLCSKSLLCEDFGDCSHTFILIKATEESMSVINKM